MEIQSFLMQWMLLPHFWLIIGMLVILGELIDGSQIFFLPIGLGCLLNSGLLYLERADSIPYGYLPESWYGMLIVLAFSSLAFSLLLMIRRRNKQNPDDVNQY